MRSMTTSWSKTTWSLSVESTSPTLWTVFSLVIFKFFKVTNFEKFVFVMNLFLLTCFTKIIIWTLKTFESSTNNRIGLTSVTCMMTVYHLFIFLWLLLFLCRLYKDLNTLYSFINQNLKIILTTKCNLIVFLVSIG